MKQESACQSACVVIRKEGAQGKGRQRQNAKSDDDVNTAASVRNKAENVRLCQTTRTRGFFHINMNSQILCLWLRLATSLTSEKRKRQSSDSDCPISSWLSSDCKMLQSDDVDRRRAPPCSQWPAGTLLEGCQSCQTISGLTV